MKAAKVLAIAQWEIKQAFRSKIFLAWLVFFPLIIRFFIHPSQQPDLTPNASAVIGIISENDSAARVLSKKDMSGTDTMPQFIFLPIKRNQHVDMLQQVKLELEAKNYDAILCFSETDKTLRMSFYIYDFVEPEQINALQRAVLKEFTGVQTRAPQYAFLFEKLSPKIIRGNTIANTADVETDILHAFVLILFFFGTTGLLGNYFGRAFAEEKSSHLLEVLQSTCSVREIILGKLAGLSMIIALQYIVMIAIYGFGSYSALIAGHTSAEVILMIISGALGSIFYLIVFLTIAFRSRSEISGLFLINFTTLLILFPTVYILSVFNNTQNDLISSAHYIPFFSTAISLMKIQARNYPLSSVIMQNCALLIFIGIAFFVSGRRKV